MTTAPEPDMVRILADDLTGACDAAVAFARAGLSTEVKTSWPPSGPSQAAVLACNTESRDLPVAAATARILEAYASLASPPPRYFFKKIDSVFRGNTLVEIAATMKSFPDAVAVLAPAFPELGRTVVNGDLHYEDVAGHHRFPIADGLLAHGLAPTLISDPAHVRSDHGLLLCDSSNPEDLSAVVRTASTLMGNRQIIWIGSGGLARALALSIGQVAVPASLAEGPGKLLFLIGSDHPVTVWQLQHLKRTHPRMTILTVTRGQSCQHLCRLIAPYLQEPLACLFVSGGDTALAVCKALDIHRLSIHSEFAPGLPQARVLGGPMEGVAFLLKSGGFGDESVLSRIAQTFSPQEMSSLP